MIPLTVPIACACDRVGEAELDALLSSVPMVPSVDTLMRQLAGRGGRPGNAAVVMTDAAHIGWFFAPGPVPPLRPHVPGGPLLLGRRLDELVPRVRAECPACAKRLVNIPLTHLPVYVRGGDPVTDGVTAVVIGAAAFSERLRAIACAVAPVPYSDAPSHPALRSLTEGELPGARRKLSSAKCLLRYVSQTGAAETVWNAREVDAPLAFEHPLTGALFALDARAPIRRAPHHVPSQGDLVWVALTPERALAQRTAYVRTRWDVASAFVGPLREDPRMVGMSAEDAARWLAAKDLAGEGRAELIRWGMELSS